jgi:hypothetical protein
MKDRGVAGHPPASKTPTGCIGVDEVEPGVVVRLDPAILLEDSRVCHTQDPPVSRPGPFVCVETEGDTSTWAGLTTTDKKSIRPSRAAGAPVGRLALKQEWRSGGARRWRFADQLLADGASVWRGPNEVFVAASWQEVKVRSPNRARLSEEGLDAVRIEIELQRHRRHRTCAD